MGNGEADQLPLRMIEYGVDACPSAGKAANYLPGSWGDLRIGALDPFAYCVVTQKHNI